MARTLEMRLTMLFSCALGRYVVLMATWFDCYLILSSCDKGVLTQSLILSVPYGNVSSTFGIQAVATR